MDAITRWRPQFTRGARETTGGAWRRVFTGSFLSAPAAEASWSPKAQLENAGAGQDFVLTDQISRSRILTSVTK